MPVLSLADLTYEEVSRLPLDRTVVLLPLGATEAHGPHLPLGTDVIIAEGMARAGGEHLEAQGVTAVVAPAFAYSVAGYAAEFPGTLSIRPETAVALLVDVGVELRRHGFSLVAFANAHLEPGHLATLHEAARLLEERGVPVAFPDVTRKPWAVRLTEEFRSGACHAGCYEGSIVLAERPDLVREELRRSLPENPVSLSRAIRAGHTTFAEAGGPRAYFGAPARATAEEGRATLATLGAILAESVLERRRGLSGAGR